MLIPFFKERSKHSREIAQSYQDWVDGNIQVFAGKLSAVTVLILAVLIPFDFLIFEHEQAFWFSQIRGLGLASMAVHIAACSVARRLIPSKKKIASWEASGQLSIFVIIYTYYLLNCSAETFPVVFTATLMAYAYAIFYAHRYWQVQTQVMLVTLAGSVTTLLVLNDQPEIGFILAVNILIISMLSLVLRAEFAFGLWQRRQLISAFVPRSIAKLAGSSSTLEDLNQYLKAEERFVVCLICDWRNFQGLANEIPAKEIAELFESYFDQVHEIVDQVVGNKTFYADWSGDQLLLVFFNPQATQSSLDREILQTALGVARKLCQDLQVRTSKGEEIQFDIGLACGPALVGLMGPSRHKKTTVAGSVPGFAKRFESEAKSLRQGLNLGRPTIVMDQDVYRESIEQRIFDSSQVLELSADQKDISGQRVFAWNPEPGWLNKNSKLRQVS